MKGNKGIFFAAMDLFYVLIVTVIIKLYYSVKPQNFTLNKEEPLLLYLIMPLIILTKITTYLDGH